MRACAKGFSFRHNIATALNIHIIIYIQTNLIMYNSCELETNLKAHISELKQYEGLGKVSKLNIENDKVKQINSFYIT